MVFWITSHGTIFYRLPLWCFSSYLAIKTAKKDNRLRPNNAVIFFIAEEATVTGGSYVIIINRFLDFVNSFLDFVNILVPSDRCFFTAISFSDQTGTTYTQRERVY